MITTTLNRIREHLLHHIGWVNLLAGLGKTDADDEPLSFAKILEINGLVNALWCCRAEPQYDKEWRLLAVKYARRVQHLNTDPAVKNAIDVAERYANGEATDEELTAARGAVGRAAPSAVSEAQIAAWAAAWAAVAKEAARAAARVAASAAAEAAADAAEAAERDWQAQEFLRVVTETEARET
jgi:hypothetical protein